VDRRTHAIYESHARFWISRRGTDPEALRHLAELARSVPARAPLADLGCGPGWFGARLRRRGRRVLGYDLSAAMLRAARERAPRLPLARGDLLQLPFARESLGGVWAKNCYMHLPFTELPRALAELHRVLRPNGRIMLSFLRPGTERLGRVLAPGVTSARGRHEGPLAGRLYTLLEPEAARDLFEGAGFGALSVEATGRLWIRARRARALPDSVRPGLELLVVGLNPSPAAAASGVAYAGANNRFWPAARAAGWLTRLRDPAHALERGIGFSDLVKRVSVSASELRPAEYRRGLRRLERLVARFEPRGLVFVGLEGWRRAVDPRALPGPVRGGFAGRPAYLAPSSSGRNARVSLAELTRHLLRARQRLY